MKETELTGQQEYEALKEYTDHTGESINACICMKTLKISMISDCASMDCQGRQSAVS